MHKLLRILMWVGVSLLGLILLLLVGGVVTGLWNGSGSLGDVIAGQQNPEPRQLQEDISLKGGQGEPYAVGVVVDTSQTLAELPPEYLSFSIDASQVVGGKWWNPQANQTEIGSGSVHAPVFDFNRPQLDLLTRALAPAYLRIGGSESDKVYYDLQSESSTPPQPPAGYQSVLTRSQWDAVNQFANRDGLKLVFTLNAGPGPRDANGAWNGTNAASLLEYTARQGYPISTWELGNEMNIFWFVHGLKNQVSTRQYGQDLEKARALVARYTPAARLGGQGSAFWPVIGEPFSLFFGYMPDYLRQSGNLIDQLSWHYYPQQSRRGPVATRRAAPARLLDPKNLDEVGYWADKMRTWRDRFAPGKPIWLGETGNAQFGGEPGLSDAYLGGLWWLDELGLAAKKDTQVVVRQTLSGMNYGMIDDATLEPRPDYWNSLLWKRLMGSKVYQATASGENASKLRVYAHSSPEAEAGSVTVLAINLDSTRKARIGLVSADFANRAYQVYALNAADLSGTSLLLNGTELKLNHDQALPTLQGESFPAHGFPIVEINPLSYSFIVFPAQ